MPSLERAVPGPALRADLSAQARARLRAGLGTGTGEAGPYRAWAVLFRTGPVSARFARPVWKFIGSSEDAIVFLTFQILSPLPPKKNTQWPCDLNFF